MFEGGEKEARQEVSKRGRVANKVGLKRAREVRFIRVGPFKKPWLTVDILFIALTESFLLCPL